MGFGFLELLLALTKRFFVVLHLCSMIVGGV